MPSNTLTRLKEISRRLKKSLIAIDKTEIIFIQGCLTFNDDEIVAYTYCTIR